MSLTRPARAPARGPRPTAVWRDRPERGSLLLLRLMGFASLRLGRPASRVILHGIALYFFLFAPCARRHMRAFLQRALGRAPRAVDRYRMVFSFATSIHDRVYLLARRYRAFRVTIDGEPLMRQIVSERSGAIMMGAHMGSFEVLRAIGERQPQLRVAMAMYEDNARKINALLSTIRPEDRPQIIALGRFDAMLKLREKLDQGMLVGLLADRSLAADPAMPVSFLGGTAWLPLGPMRAAALLHRRVVFMLGLYRGGNRYHLVFQPLADFSQTAARQRAAAVQQAVVRYAALLEQYCRSDPSNWFNFYDFWRPPAPGAAAEVPA